MLETDLQEIDAALAPQLSESIEKKPATTKSTASVSSAGIFKKTSSLKNSGKPEQRSKLCCFN